MTTKPFKPLRGPIFGRVGHLPGSRTGEKDHHISEREASYYTEGRKNAKDRIIVTEKMDGACVGVYRTPSGGLVCLQRHGYPVQTSHRWWIAEFEEWAHKYRHKFLNALDPGEWLVGEWLFYPHGVKYNLKYNELFMPFSLRHGDYYNSSTELPYHKMVARLDGEFALPGVIADDGEPVKVEEVRRYIVRRDQPYSRDKPEGAVWRREGDGFIQRAKWVRHDHIPGMYWEERKSND